MALLRRALIPAAWTLLAACGGAPPPAVAPAPSPSSGASATPAAGAPVDEAPLPEDELARGGHAAFDRACARCHDGTAGPSLANLALTAERMDAALYTGSDDRRLMPTVAPTALAAADVPALIAYLRTIRAVR